ncbi:TetR family transcriptional regulator [Nocardioides panaciterrulae]|uniref:AcrR family transcriptional regulator n=1 Tax=Nocardioides panaciterrulae TaxID=661492 RepID=A0A7Y9E9E1_9ACTN|nr:TetR family transcriptional regulator [Nocardioides panaciterrulae]NYD43427.1 AcrR family transcriptional regulator [Nocardioides panaciterrulae]
MVSMGTLGAGEEVRRQRLLHGITLRELAGRLGVSAATVSAIENGRTRISLERLHRVAEVLDVPVATLVPGAATTPVAAHPAPTIPAEPTVAAPTGHWRDFAPLPIDGVLAGAIRAFVAIGYHGASMRSIAQLAGMSVPGVYHHYPSKQDLLVRVFDLTMTDLIWRVEQARAEGRDPVARVSLVVEALALFHARRNDLAFIGASEMRSLDPENYRRIARLRSDVQRLLDDQIAEAIAAGGLDVAYPADAGRAIATMCTSLAQWFHPGGPTTPEQVAREYARFALSMLGLPLEARRVGAR